MIDLMAYPVLGICGWSNSGKTTLVEQLLYWFAQESLSVIVVKRDVHGINLDVEGKDTDRFYRAGADVLIQGPEQTFIRSHHHDQAELIAAIPALAARYDFVLFEGHRRTAVPKIWLLAPDQEAPPAGLENCLAVLKPEEDHFARVKEWVRRRLQESQSRRPV
jgi:molybdopterin-guanine dinucleotide biosynthesis protein B